jgi:hypothetical protein
MTTWSTDELGRIAAAGEPPSCLRAMETANARDDLARSTR